MRASVFVSYVCCSLPLAFAQDLFLSSEISTPLKTANISKEADHLLKHRRAGILYSVWHTIASGHMRQIAAKGGDVLTVEKVIRSNGEKTLDDVLVNNGIPGGDMYNVEPAELGFYCLYKKREGEIMGGHPNCPNTMAVARRHAALLLGAGFDYIYVDLTNWPKAARGVDVLVLRPLEVLMDHWLELRAEGTPTPDVVAWTRTLPDSYDDGTPCVWKWALDNIYNHPERKTLIWRRPRHPDHMVWFITANNNRMPDVEATIASNGGAEDIAIIPVWAGFAEHSYHTDDMWGFFSACTHGPRRAPTTSMVGTPDVLGDCDQWCTNDVLEHIPDVEISAAAGYMLSQSGLPFGQTGHLRGLTLQRTFKKVHEKGSLNLIMSSFNEHIGGRQTIASTSPLAFNQGLPNDPQKGKVWVDTYGSEYSRDIEPSVEGGDLIYQVTKSCVTMYKKGWTCDEARASEELCCTTEDKQIWNNVWSLQGTGNPNKHALTTKSSDRASWEASGKWAEVCNPFSGPSVFCYKANTDGRNGPFMTYSIPDAKEETLPLNLCWDGTLHFASNDPDCEGASVAHELGYVSTTRGGETLRELQRCKHPDGGFTHSLDIPCFEGWDADGSLGYVK